MQPCYYFGINCILNLHTLTHSFIFCRICNNHIARLYKLLILNLNAFIKIWY